MFTLCVQPGYVFSCGAAFNVPILVFFNTMFCAFTGLNKLFPKVMCVVLLL
jgi:hypothetical protein